MEIRVFDENKNPVSIRYRDIINVKMVNRRICYITEDNLYYGAVNLKEQALLHETQGMLQVDKNSAINMNHVEHVIKGDAYINGRKYPVSRRRKPKLNRIWRERKK